MRNFFNDTIANHPLFRSAKRVDDTGLLEPDLRRKVFKIVGEAHDHGLELMVYETYRSQERQRELFRRGVTQLKQVGVHHYGLACDLVRVVEGEPSWDGDFTLLGHLARAHGLVWGGDWPRLRDMPHVQRCAVKDQAKLFAGTWYPTDGYDPRL